MCASICLSRNGSPAPVSATRRMPHAAASAISARTSSGAIVCGSRSVARLPHMLHCEAAQIVRRDVERRRRQHVRPAVRHREREARLGRGAGAASGRARPRGRRGSDRRRRRRRGARPRCAGGPARGPRATAGRGCPGSTCQRSGAASSGRAGAAGTRERGERCAGLVGVPCSNSESARSTRRRIARPTSSTAAIRSCVPPRHLSQTGIAARPSSICARNARYFSPRQIAANDVSKTLPITNARPCRAAGSSTA